jgi:hypothetical protein
MVYSTYLNHTPTTGRGIGSAGGAKSSETRRATAKKPPGKSVGKTLPAKTPGKSPLSI